MTDPPATFRQLVRDMRALQKQYFRDRSRSNLRAALKLELKVDAWLERHGDELAQQVEIAPEVLNLIVEGGVVDPTQITWHGGDADANDA